MKYLIAIVAGYLLGSVNPAYILGKIKGYDIRERGSGNAGASNAKICMGWWAFFIVLVYDFLKAIISIILLRQLYPESYSASVVAGSFSVIGHIFPFYLNFKGGKGFASYIGLVSAIDYRLLIILAVIGLILAFSTNWIVSATFTFIIGFPILCIVTNQPIEVILAASIVSIIIFLKHISNLKKVRNGQEIGINNKMVTIFASKEAKERIRQEELQHSSN